MMDFNANNRVSDLANTLAVDTLAGRDAPDGVVVRSDLLPPGTHGSNLRGLLSKNTWDRLRAPVCAAANDRCEICGDRTVRRGRPGHPDCHEKWLFGFRDGQPVQVLARLIALCPGCHQVQHSGLARINRAEHQVIERLRRLNNWTPQQAENDLIRSDRRCRHLERFAWDLDLSALAGRLVIDGYPDLYIPAPQRPLLGNSAIGVGPAVLSALT